MVFSSITFLIFFLPSLLLSYFVIPKRFRSVRNVILLLFSTTFYAWGGLKYLWVLLLSVAVNYICGIFAQKGFSRKIRMLAVAFATVVGLGLLGWFKYSVFFAESFNVMGFNLPVPEVVLPIGISFYTFQGLSYVIDVYRDDATVQKNPAYLALYITLFPQLVAGPIVRYTDVAQAITERQETAQEASAGALRFVLGLGKKMICANQMAEIADAIFDISISSLTTSLAWMGAIAYTLQIYLDFSAYSDMAIGLGRIFGFQFGENFNYPYIAKSITEFWRRWHISLSSWFRDYVYIPLGGRKCERWKHIRNIAVVWLLTGLWHGANWTFVIWGIWFCVFLLGEKFLWGNTLERAPGIVRHMYTLLVVILSWVFFRSESIGNAISFITVMFGNAKALWCKKTLFYLHQYGWYLLICCICVCPIKCRLETWLQRHERNRMITMVYVWCPKFFAIMVLFLAYMKLVTGSFNPFIYFQF